MLQTKLLLYIIVPIVSAMTAAPKVTYWRGRGRVEPLRCILAAAGVEFENVFLTRKEDLQELRASGKLEYDQVPLVEIDGLNLVQGLPTAYYLAQKSGLLPSSPVELYLVGQIYVAAQDARAPFLQYPFNNLPDPPSLEKVLAAAEQSPKGLVQRYCPKWETQLAKTNGPFFLEGETTTNRPSLADIGVFEVLDFYRHITSEDRLRVTFASFPKLLQMHDAVLELGRIKHWRDVERPKVFLDWHDYAKSVCATLS
jgi:hypothetical protein